MDKVEIDKNKIISLYKSRDEKCKKLLENIFGKKWLLPSIQERVKTFEDACNELGEEHSLIRQWNKWKQNGTNIRTTIAYLKLCIITAALNEGWQPKFTKQELRYYPFFVFHSQEDIDKMEEEEIKTTFNKPLYNAYPYGRLMYRGVDGNTLITSSVGGAHLVFKSIELAEYAGNQFIDIYGKFIIGR